MRLNIFYLVGAWVACQAQAAATPQKNAPVAKTLNGSYYGLHDPVYNQDAFLGVRFAQPPVGDLRFALPQSLNETWSGLRNATEVGYSCVGYYDDTEIAAHNYTSEDCLFANIVRPAGFPYKPLPVAVWIYGGGFTTGSSTSGWYNTTFLVERSVQLGQPIIAVSLNYRLAGWGWLWSEEIVKAGLTNVGLRDQRLALHWIKENIAAFGGDPSQITIFGESAGALSVSNHVFAYNGRDDGLFRAALGQSGSPAGVGPWSASIEKLSLATANITKTLCPDATDKLACLRKASFESLNNAINATLTLPFAGPMYGPVVDGDIVARSLVDQLRDGSFVKVPYVLGTNNDETGYYTPFGLNTEEDLLAALLGSSFSLNFTQAANIMSRYPYSEPELAAPEVSNSELNTTVGLMYKRCDTIGTDIVMKAPTRFAAQEWQKHSPHGMYIYNSNTTLSVGERYLGAAHGFELAYTFYNLNGSGWEGGAAPFLGGNPFAGRPQPYLDLAGVISGMWIGFFNTAKPHYANASMPLTEWPEYKGSDPSIMIFDAQPSHVNVRVGKEPRRAQQDYVISQLY